MGRYLLCETKTRKPYVIRELGLRLYSPEELCYYIDQNLAILDADFLCEELYSYISEECHMPETARKMRQTAKQGKNALDALYLFLKNVCYYNDTECNLFLQKLRKREKMPPQQIHLRKAELFIEKGRYEEALKQYEQVLRDRPAHTKDARFYTELYDRAGCVAMQMGQFYRALQLFQEGWRFSANEELGRKLCYACFLAEEEPKEQEERLPQTLIAGCLKEYEQLVEEAVKQVGEGPVSMVMTANFQGRKDEAERYFYEKKCKYRQMAEKEL